MCFCPKLSGALAALSLFALATALPVSAQVPIKLYNTGVNSDGTVATIGTVDQHYTQITPAGNPLAYVSDYPSYAQSTNSQYISPDTNGGASYLGEFYTVDYQTTFTLTGTELASTVISGDWSTDNLGNDILINGHSTGLTSGGFGSFTHFDLSPFASDFQTGLNTLDFVWTDQGGPGALDVQNLSGTSSPVPEASTTVSLGLLLAFSLGSLVVARKRQASAV